MPPLTQRVGRAFTLADGKGVTVATLTPPLVVPQQHVSS
jgi:hypothetical protein